MPTNIKHLSTVSTDVYNFPFLLNSHKIVCDCIQNILNTIFIYYCYTPYLLNICIINKYHIQFNLNIPIIIYDTIQYLLNIEKNNYNMIQYILNSDVINLNHIHDLLNMVKIILNADVKKTKADYKHPVLPPSTGKLIPVM